MEEDKLKDLFVDFKPELSSDFLFMSKLRNNLDRVEMIRRHNIEISAKRKKAVAIAACVGFIVGFLFSLALPSIGNIIIDLQSSLPPKSTLKIITDNYLTISLLLIGGASVFISLTTYDLSLWLMKQKQ